MSRPCSLFDAPQKSALFLITASMRYKRGQHVRHPLVKTFYLVGRLFFIRTDIEAHDDQLFPIAAPIVRPAKCAYFEDFHRSMNRRDAEAPRELELVGYSLNTIPKDR